MAGVDINEAGKRISQLFSQPEQPSESEAPVEDSSPQDQQEEVLQQEAEQPEAEIEEQAEATETPESDTEVEEPKYTVKVQGEEIEVSLEDLRKGYMMDSDYRKKTSEVARMREEVNKAQELYGERLSEAETLLKLELEDLNSEDNKDLKEIDPTAYYEKKEKIEAKSRRLKDLKKEQKEVEEAKRQRLIQQEQELLMQRIPEWLDDEALAKETKMIQNLWNEIGFKESDLSKFTDHRLVALSRKAALYDQLMTAKPDQKKVKQAPPKSAKPGTIKTPEQRQSDKVKDIKSKVRKTGNMKDAAAAIRQLMR